MQYKTRKGFYLDLSKSPYTYRTPNGIELHFASQKKLEMFMKYVRYAGDRIDKALRIAGDLRSNIDSNTIANAKSAIMISIYKEGSTAWRTRKDR